MTRPRWHAAARLIGGSHWVPFQIADALQRQLDAAAAELARSEENLGRHTEALQRASAQIQRLRGTPAPQGDDRGGLLARIRELEQALAHSRTQVAAHQRALEEARRKADEARAEADEMVARAVECERAEASGRRALDRQWTDARDLASRVAGEDVGSDEFKRQAQQLAADLKRVLAQREEALDRGRREERILRLRGLATLIDSMRLSIDSAPDDLPEAWRRGQRMIVDLAEAEMRAAGAHPFAAVDEVFDPHTHQALAVDGSGPEGRIVRVESPGYRLGDGELVRPARVVVGGAAGQEGSR